MSKKFKFRLNVVSLVLLFGVLFLCSRYGSGYQIRILNNIAIFITLAVSYNLINGVCGLLHLGPNGFIAIGAYTSALLSMTPAEKELNFIIEHAVWPIDVIHVPFAVSLVAAGVVAACFAFLISFPVLRVRGDYLAIVTLGFGEVIRVLCNAGQSVTNGPLGLKGLYPYTNLWWSWGVATLTVVVIQRLINSNYGLAMKAVREDETAARAMGVDPFRRLMLAFLISAFFSGIGGGLLAHLITTISPGLFTFFLTFNLLIMIVVGGLGSTTGAIIGAVLFAWGGEALRVVERPMEIGSFTIPGIPGMRMVIFSLILMLVILFARKGIMGRSELSWDSLESKLAGWRRSQTPP
ncbi:MAG: branched-chain amino acid ABC transporter permease [Syntrophobacteraceae bacterium]